MIGEVEGVLEGTAFADRQALHDAGVHRGVQQGIGGGGESIVLSGGYVDDRDDGDVIIYTGQGGRDAASGRQIADQQLTRGNLALSNHYREGNPIRVCRGHQLDSPYAPSRGYRYDGLYRIDSFWSEQGADGFLVWRFRLIKIGPTEIIEPAAPPSESPAGTETPSRSPVYTSRIIRNSMIGNHVKALYDYRCQISGVRLDTPGGPYAEACHIRPVGAPHDGPDVVGNVLCLSPNMHVMFDLGAVAIADDFSLIGHPGKLALAAGHGLLIDAIRYHRQHIYRGSDEA